MKILLHPRALVIGLGVFILLAWSFFGWQFFHESEPGAGEGGRNTQASVAARGAGNTSETEAGMQARVPAPSGSESDWALAAKEAKLKDVVRLLRQYARLWEKLAAEHPGLENINDAIHRWSQHGRSEQYPAQKKTLAELTKDNPEALKGLFKIMYLQRASVLLRMIDDPNSQYYMRRVLETAGYKAAVPRELALLDIYAGDAEAQSRYPAQYPVPQTLEEYRAMLESRIDRYALATQQLANASGTAQAIDEEMLAVMSEQMQSDITVDYLKLYHDSFFTDEVKALAAQIRQLITEYEAYPSNLNVNPTLLSEYLSLVQSRSLHTRSNLDLAVLGKNMIGVKARTAD